MLKLSGTINDAVLNQIETQVGSSPKFRMLSGPAEANTAAPQTGTLIVEIQLPADWMNAAAGGLKTMLGVWAAKSIAAATAGHFRVVNNAGTVCHMLGTITATGGGGDMEMPNPAVPSNKWVIIDTFTLAALNV